VSVSFDRVAESFDRTRRFPAFVTDKIVQTFVRELEGYSNILDVAVGTGRFAKPLQDVGYEIVGIDISAKMLKEARKKGTRGLIEGDACCLPFPESAFDAAISVGTLHLITDWRLALREITRVTRRSLFTVLREGPYYSLTPSGKYKELLKRYGVSYAHPGVGLWKLKETLTPKRSTLAASYEVSASEKIAFLAEKAFSYQWNVPDGLHRKAMRELKRMFSKGQTYSCDVYVHEWDVNAVRDGFPRSTT